MLTGKMENFNGVPIYTPNNITAEKEDFYISYNNRDTAIYGSDTTALVNTKNGNPVGFLILNGNHVEQYNRIIENRGNYNDCLTYFKANIDKISKYSDRLFVEDEEK